MMIASHKNARTTPAIRAEIASSTASATSLAQRFGVTEATVYKWKKRTSFQDCSHTAHRLQTTLSPAQERVVVELRRTLLLPLDDLLAVTRDSSAPKPPAAGWTAACAAMAWATSMRSSQPHPVSHTRASKATSRATCTWT